MNVYFVRHGETQAHYFDVIDSPWGELSERGHDQSHHAGNVFKNVPLSRVYISDLRRAQQTASAILDHHHALPVVMTKNLNERNYGVFMGKPRSWFRDARNASSVPYHEFRPTAGESIQDTYARVASFLDEEILPRRASSETVLIASHCWALAAMCSHLLRVPISKYQSFFHENTGITKFEINPHTVSMPVFNSTHHLAESRIY
ncbi:MAG: hypothetical protein COU08_00530 [Candidatus Harrisonbacteria bacterium CG10_big_fil_rev_8_21_14_0_10_42_17]|uniref:Histidine phosphatase family protein n=1 Tax=Candidatus Harrisonbacteria bacterium CG10_big_fil_rev_8_21_14_0_10_42_17 TaxID=1974584 RepID=A0A2M6WJ25_9BACT|nr:MAG: hypothetical protein COU08_00530 [Candidatus Harrisonbacteria bacterium CG10_big_fil_rev_8_21_14_0_10_42_17]